jgi:hypothetical protein
MAATGNSIAIKSFQSFAISDDLLQKVVEAVKAGEKEARSNGVQSFEVFYKGFRQNICIGRIYIVPASVCSNRQQFPIALLYGTVVRELNLGEETADLISKKMGESEFDEYSQADFQTMKDAFFKDEDGKYTSLVIFAPSWSNVRDYVYFKFTEDDAKLSNLLRHQVFSCYFDPRLSSAFDALMTSVDTTKWDVTDVTPKLQYPGLTANPLKQYPELEKAASLTRRKKAFLSRKNADELVQQELDPQELDVFQSLDQALSEALMPDTKTPEEAAGDFKAPGEVTTAESGDRNNPDYGEEGSYTEVMNGENEKAAAVVAAQKQNRGGHCAKATIAMKEEREKSAGDRHDDVPVAPEPNVFQGGDNTKAEDSKTAGLFDKLKKDPQDDPKNPFRVKNLSKEPCDRCGCKPGEAHKSTCRPKKAGKVAFDAPKTNQFIMLLNQLEKTKNEKLLETGDVLARYTGFGKQWQAVRQGFQKQQLEPQALSDAIVPLRRALTQMLSKYASTSKFAKVEGLVLKTASIKVTFGTNNVYFDMNGSKYMLDGADAESFLNEWLAYRETVKQAEQRVVNQMAEKYMSKMKRRPDKAQKVTPKPAVPEQPGEAAFAQTAVKHTDLDEKKTFFNPNTGEDVEWFTCSDCGARYKVEQGIMNHLCPVNPWAKDTNAPKPPVPAQPDKTQMYASVDKKAEYIASLLGADLDDNYDARSTRTKAASSKREEVLTSKYASRKVADVPLTEDSIWSELTEDFGEAPQVELPGESSGGSFGPESKAPNFENKTPKEETYEEPKREEPKSEGEESEGGFKSKKFKEKSAPESAEKSDKSPKAEEKKDDKPDEKPAEKPVEKSEDNEEKSKEASAPYSKADKACDKWEAAKVKDGKDEKGSVCFNCGWGKASHGKKAAIDQSWKVIMERDGSEGKTSVTIGAPINNNPDLKEVNIYATNPEEAAVKAEERFGKGCGYHVYNKIPPEERGVKQASADVYKGIWIDSPHGKDGYPTQGFSNYPGIYLVLPGSNSAYGNTEGGFANEEEAEAYNQTNLGGDWQVRRYPDTYPCVTGHKFDWEPHNDGSGLGAVKCKQCGFAHPNLKEGSDVSGDISEAQAEVEAVPADFGTHQQTEDIEKVADAEDFDGGELTEDSETGDPDMDGIIRLIRATAKNNSGDDDIDDAMKLLPHEWHVKLCEELSGEAPVDGDCPWCEAPENYHNMREHEAAANDDLDEEVPIELGMGDLANVVVNEEN